VESGPIDRTLTKENETMTNDTQQHTIEIAYNAHEAAEFVAWLNNQGHNATVGNDTGSYINGVETGNDEETNEMMTSLWDEYCNA
jgi:hypothetical protein